MIREKRIRLVGRDKGINVTNHVDALVFPYYSFSPSLNASPTLPPTL